MKSRECLDVDLDRLLEEYDQATPNRPPRPRWCHSIDTLNKIRASRIGTKHDEKTKQKISKSLRAYRARQRQE